MAKLEKQQRAKLSGFTLIENLVAVTLILLVFVGASTAFLKFSLLPKWQEQLRGQSIIELDYNSLKHMQEQPEFNTSEQIEGYKLSRKMDSVANRLFKVNYILAENARIILEKNYYLLDGEW